MASATDEITIELPSENLIVRGRNLLIDSHHPNHSFVRHKSPAKGDTRKAAAPMITIGWFVRMDFTYCLRRKLVAINEDFAGWLRTNGLRASYMLLADRMGGRGRCGGRGRGFRGISASESRIGLNGIGDGAALRRSKAADSLAARFRTSMDSS